MSAFSAFTPVAPPSLILFEGLLNALPVSRHPELFSQTLNLLDLPRQGLGFEAGILEEALSQGDAAGLERASALYQRYGRLFYEAARQAETFVRLLGVEVAPPAGPVPQRPCDLRAQMAWDRFAALERGAADFVDEGAFYDPVGAMSHGVIHLLDREGQHDRLKYRQDRGEDWTPPPSFGVLSRESAARLERYNRGENDQLGDVAFDFPPELQMVVVPRVYAPLLRSHLRFQVIVPASDQLESTFTPEKASELPHGVRLLTGIKGLPGGKTPLEHFERVLAGVGVESSVSDAMGYASASKIVKEQRSGRSGRGGRGDLLDIVLSDPHTINALEIAKRMAGQGHSVRQERFEGVPVIVVENLGLRPPVRFMIVSDRDVIRANEKASIDKNLQAIRLGSDLFTRMLEKTEERWMGDPLLYNEFAQFYQQSMEEAEADILQALTLEGIREEKRVILPGVRKDLYGSWTTTSFEPLYQLVQQIFDPEAPKEGWQEAMVLLKLRIGGFYSVRNPQYGFCVAADRAAVMRGRWLSRDDLAATVKRLQSRGILADRDGQPMSEATAAKRVGLAAPNDAHFFFSMIPEGLTPEGLQVAEQLPVRYRRKLNQAPQSYRDAHLLVQRLQHSVFFAPEIYRNIVDLSKDLAFVLPGAPSAKHEPYLLLLEALNSHFEKGLGVLKASKLVFGRSRDTQALLTQLVTRMRILIQRVRDNKDLNPDQIALLNQGVIEALTIANLFYILPPEQSDREAAHLLRRMKGLLHYAKSGKVEDLFPLKTDPKLDDAGLGSMLLGLRPTLLKTVSGGLIELTYRMNVRLHSEDRAITRKDVAAALEQIGHSLDGTARSLGESSPQVDFFLGGMKTTLKSIASGFQENKKLKAPEWLLIYQALVECLIHTRRFLVFPEDRAGTELQYTYKRFLKILDFVQGRSSSPLWHFGNGNSNPPPP